MDHAIEHSPNGTSGHESREASIKLIVLSAAGLSIVVFVVFVLMVGMFDVLKSTENEQAHQVSPLGPATEIPPQPRIQEHPWEELQQLRAREQNTLTTYGWQNQKDGIVRIPIDRAIDIMAQKGFPTTPPGRAPAVAPPPVPATQGRPAGAPKASPVTAAPAGVSNAK